MSDIQALITQFALPIFTVLVGLHLPSFISLVSTTPAYEHMPTSRTLNKLDGSHNAWRRIFLGNRQ
jgi:hypothetical protein